MNRILKALGMPRFNCDMSKDQLPKIKIGVCAMDKKANSKPMKEIIKRLLAYGEFEIEPFGDHVILESPIEEWPVCDCLLSWHSEGFPLKKAQAYVQLRRPFLVNDLMMQDHLLDRRDVYRILEENNIPVPFHIVVSRDRLEEGVVDPPGFVEHQDYVELGGFRVMKPFVEKPVCGEDHNIYIYYPDSMGGGVKKLFRKLDDRSSMYDPNHPGTVRRDGSYIYEEFLATGGTDVKVYTIGPRYAHAEARKSPVVDGKVLRSPDGKEMRFPVLLSPQEKEISRMVCLAFGQKICGFDLLRSEKGRSFVCDVNGWSFVKNSKKYYDDAAGILHSIILSALAPHRLSAAPKIVALVPALSSEGLDEVLEEEVVQEEEEDELVPGVDPAEIQRTNDRSTREELRCLLAVIRHGDRTPKQKLKLLVTQEPLLALFNKHKDSKGKQAKLKDPQQLQELLDITRSLLQGMESGDDSQSTTLSQDQVDEVNEMRDKLRLVRTVLEQGTFSGINRKVQLKPTRWSCPQPPAEGAETAIRPSSAGGATPDKMHRLSGAGSVSMNRSAAAEQPRVLEECILIVKWGGVLTHAGRLQAENLGREFRLVMYPRSGGAGGGLLRLHSTYRHDFKIYSSDEGRVQTSAAAFTKGLLDLEGTSLTPILVSLVKKDASMLEAYGKGVSNEILAAKKEVYMAMTWDPEKTSVAITPRLLSPPASPRIQSLTSFSVEAPIAGAGMKHNASTPEITQATLPSTLPYKSSPNLVDEGSVASSSDNLLAGETSAELQNRLNKRFNRVQLAAVVPDSGSEGSPRHSPLPVTLLRQMVTMMQGVVDELRKRLQEKMETTGAPRFSSIGQDPKEWVLDEERPCGGERFLLMFDRWQKLLKSFYNAKKEKFDISKIPDIYDSVKYDAIHNRHLGLDMTGLYTTAKRLADIVIPNEYGIDPAGKLRIGSSICGELLGKLMTDLISMREESLETAPPSSLACNYDLNDAVAGFVSLEDEKMVSPARSMSGGLKMNVPSISTAPSMSSTPSVPNGGEVGGLEGEEYADEGVMHRLCPTYASDINSPLRHVRTRIYFTSESHIHSLVNVLRYCHLQSQHGSGVVMDEAEDILEETTELDYLTQIVFRMYENKSVHVASPERFRVEILFSPGASCDPFDAPPCPDHALPTVPRTPLTPGEGVALADLETLVKPFALTRKFVPCSYVLQHTLRGPTASTPVTKNGMNNGPHRLSTES